MHADGDDDRPNELNDLPREIAPPADLANRIARNLKRQGLVVAPRSTFIWRAALILLPLVGFGAGWFLKAVPHDRHSDGQPRFVLLLYGGTDSASDDGVREYGEWARRLVASGTEVSGEKLADDVELLVGAPLSASARADLRGFFIVQAANDRQAHELAISHPHLKRGGTIVVRRIDPT